MNEKKEITKQLIKNIFINFIIFTTILLVFDFIIYNQVINSLYKDIDKQLENSLHMYRTTTTEKYLKNKKNFKARKVKSPQKEITKTMEKIRILAQDLL